MSEHLIIGGNGFLGSSMATFLLDKGEHVSILDTYKPKIPNNNIKYFVGSVSDKDVVINSLMNIDYVHYYAVYIPMLPNNKEIIKINIEGLRNVLDECLNKNIKKLIIVSSSTIYDNCTKMPITEEHQPNPLDFYGKVRLQAEHLTKSYIDRGLQTIIFRPHIIAGGQREGIFKNIIDNKDVWIPAASDYIHQFIHVDDLINAIWLSFDYKYSDTFNIGQDMKYTFKELILKIIDKMDSKTKIKFIPTCILNICDKIDRLLETSILGPNKILTKSKGFYFDCTKVKKSLNWKAKYSDYETIEESFDNFLEKYKR